MESQTAQRRAIEALRSGVPNRDAVRVMGSSQPRIEARFKECLDSVKEIGQGEGPVQGFLMAGGFGSGKSHLLEYFQHLALLQNFVCSKIVISKETPLYDLAKVYRAAVAAAMVPHKRGDALTEVAAGLNFGGQPYADFYGWAGRPQSGLNSRFGATLYLYENLGGDHELGQRILSFWSGDRINASEMRKALRERGQAATFRIDTMPPPKDLAVQRFRFTSRLIAAAGYAGWVLLVDEVELVGRYSFKQRARSYAELARLANRLEGEGLPGLLGVMAVTDDFEAKMFDDKPYDRETIPGRLRASDSPADLALAGQAERGIRLISSEHLDLEPPANHLIAQMRQKVRDTHADAHRWDPPEAGLPPEHGITTPVRTYVRYWINEWDLRRAFPDHTANIDVIPVERPYEEDLDLQVDIDLEIPEDHDEGDRYRGNR